MNMIDIWLNKLKDTYGEDTDLMQASMEHLLCSIEYQRHMTRVKGKTVNIVPKNIDDISVGDMVYIQLEVGYPFEIWYGHWCYILKDTGSKFLVIPSTSDHGCEDEKYDMKIDTVIGGEITASILSLSDMRFVDKQRVDQRRAIGKVLTPKSEIRKRVFEFLKEEK